LISASIIGASSIGPAINYTPLNMSRMLTS
jgi:hypothetical protein